MNKVSSRNSQLSLSQRSSLLNDNDSNDDDEKKDKKKKFIKKVIIGLVGGIIGAIYLANYIGWDNGFFSKILDKKTYANLFYLVTAYYNFQKNISQLNFDFSSVPLEPNITECRQLQMLIQSIDPHNLVSVVIKLFAICSTPLGQSIWTRMTNTEWDPNLFFRLTLQESSLNELYQINSLPDLMSLALYLDYILSFL